MKVSFTIERLLLSKQIVVHRADPTRQSVITAAHKSTVYSYVLYCGYCRKSQRERYSDIMIIKTHY